MADRAPRDFLLARAERTVRRAQQLRRENQARRAATASTFQRAEAAGERRARAVVLQGKRSGATATARPTRAHAASTSARVE